MNKKALYLAIYQITGSPNADADLNSVTDFHRNVAVHVARNSGREISYISLEFSGVRSRYLSTIIFDGSGDKGVSLLNFAMPKVRMSHLQKALALLAILNFLTEEGILNTSDWDYYRERISMEFDNGQQNLLSHFADIKNKANKYAAEHADAALLKMPEFKPSCQNFVV